MITNEEREFIGFFWGEGNMAIRKSISHSSKIKKNHFNPTIKITQREDNPFILQWCKTKFGGSIWRRDKTSLSMKRSNYIANPRLTWEVQGFKRCREVIKVLEQGILNDKKKQELKIYKEFLYSGVGAGRTTPLEVLEKQYKMKKDLSFLRSYRPLIASK